jgi:hypothetical protein
MKEKPEYSEISELEMRDLEAEFGRPLTREKALWLIRNRMNRAAVELMLNEEKDVHEENEDNEDEQHPAGLEKEAALAARSSRG